MQALRAVPVDHEAQARLSAVLAMAVVETMARPKMDWTQIMIDLHDRGIPAYRVALILCVSDTAAYNWMKNGRGVRKRCEPGYALGKALLALHTKVCGADLTTQRISESDQAGSTSP